MACVCDLQINIDDYTGDENEEKNPYPVNDFPGIPSVAVNFQDTLLPSTEFHLVRDEGKLDVLYKHWVVQYNEPQSGSASCPQQRWRCHTTQ